MKFKSEFINAVKLFLLLSLLFRTFTWNSSIYFDFTRPNFGEMQKASSDVDYAKSGVTVFMKQHSVLIESLSSVRYESGRQTESATHDSIFIPPFNEWKEKEMTKYEKGSPNDVDFHHHKKQVRRKLNYASSKCGAKVLASNPEARFRLAVLSEKPEEYMLNPCRAKRWFVVELCDTVEATQFELANYELYSSSPREFSLFWSEVYPTTEWHLLGTFEAKDQRTMQTFDLNTKNLGKFIKVIIYNHHGKEHYCPLSVIRVLGYSMVQKFEDIETSESDPNYFTQHVSGVQIDKNVLFDNEKIHSKNILSPRDVSASKSSTFSIKICALFFMHCADTTKIGTDKLCANEPMCRFLVGVILKTGTDCHEVFCFEVSKKPTNKIHSAIYGEKLKDPVDLSSKTLSDKVTYDSAVKVCRSTYKEILRMYGHKKYFKISKHDKNSTANETGTKEDDLSRSKLDLVSSTKNLTNGVNTSTEIKVKHTGEHRQSAVKVKENRVCEANLNDPRLQGDTVTKESISPTPLRDDSTIESAGLSHTESVLFKLTARIKASEKDLSFINKYLQQLSQSYRQQMTDMKFMFDQTLKAINIQSEKAKIVDDSQDESINALEKKTKALSLKIYILMSEQRDMLKRVVELHGFFLILEFIVISTIFTVFLNIFRRKSDSVINDRIRINNIWNNLKDIRYSRI